MNKVTLKEIRKRYDSYNQVNTNINPFVIRIREKEDIIYYNGIRVFKLIDINETLDHAYITISDNIYKLNKTIIANLQKKAISVITDLREQMHFFSFHLKSIELRKGSLYEEKKASTILKRIQASLKKYHLNLDFNRIQKDFLTKNNSLIQLDFSHFTQKELVTIEYIFIRECIFEQNQYTNKTGFAIPRFHYDTKYLKIDLPQSESELICLEHQVKHATELYEKNTKLELEKRYQHQFMISPKIKEKGVPSFQTAYRFEEEYYTIGDHQKRGRIDNLFLNVSKTQSEVSFIELKVNDTVLLGPNGIHRHLMDLETELRQNHQKVFENIKNRMNYRLKQTDSFFQIIDFKKNQQDQYLCQYYVIIAFTDKMKITDKVVTLLKEIYTEDDSVKQMWSKNSLIQDCEVPRRSKSLKTHASMLEKLGCQVHFLIDENWNLEISGDLFLTLEQFLERYLAYE